MIHDQNCRCRSCKPAHARPSGFLPVLQLACQPVPPHVRRNMDRILTGVAGLVAVCTIVMVAWGQA